MKRDNPVMRPSFEFEPFVAFTRSLSAIAGNLGLDVERGVDDLDAYERIFTRTRHGLDLMIIRYAGVPVSTVDVYIPTEAMIDGDLRSILQDILDTLELTTKDLLIVPEFMSARGGGAVAMM